jgi:hypothetical protein
MRILKVSFQNIEQGPIAKKLAYGTWNLSKEICNYKFVTVGRKT